ncbi:hypothetical protein VH441_07205 [Psychrobacter sp. HD31]|uniref:hypothetical protein n=1 Tax=Psychrobacter sp. HD31 TaxID=3112003 RepID=UPI003DA40387
MAANFLIMDDEGRKQVVDNAIDLRLSNTFSVDGVHRLSVFDVCAIQPTGTYKIYEDNSIWGSDYPHSFYGKGLIHVFDYGYTTSPSDAKYGIEVYDENGKLTFSSAFLSLNILDVVQIDIRDNARYENGERVYWSKDYGHSNVAIIPLTSPWFAADGKESTVACLMEGTTLKLARKKTNHGDASRLISTFYFECLVIDTSFY